MKLGIVDILVFLAILGCSANQSPHNKDEKSKMDLKQEKICIVAISKLDSSLLEKLRVDLEEIFEQKVEVIQNPMDLEFAYNPQREQYYSSAILEKLTERGPESCDKILGIIDVDLYVPDLNFVFGEADVLEKTAVISTKRLRPSYYDLPEDERLLWERTLKEAVHELGHTYGLPHCPDEKCVMHFSNSLQDTDIKSPSFCENCKKKLMSVMRLEG
jgi:archaemetzincin